MKKNRLLILVKYFSRAVLIAAMSVFYLAGSVYGQFGIPKVPKIPKPTPEVVTKPDTTSGDGSNVKMQTKTSLIPGHYDFSATEPLIDKTSIVFRLLTSVSEYSRGTEGKPQVWIPTPTFTVFGPIETGGVINVAYTLPNGSAWFNHDCTNLNKIGAGLPASIECERSNVPKDAPTTQTGVFGIKITLRNELLGTNVELFTGKFKVESWVDNPTNDPRFSKQFIYYPNLDWKLPMALIYSTPPKDQYDTNGPLKAQMWFRGNRQNSFEGTTVGHLFYQGKEVASTNAFGSNNVTSGYTEGQAEESEHEYQARVFIFNAFVFDKDGSGSPQWFPIYKNPGEYEIKVLQNGKLSRSVKFSVDAGGNIVNNGINKNNKLGTTRILVPAQIIGEQDGKWNRTAWQTEGFLGTPLTGFTAP